MCLFSQCSDQREHLMFSCPLTCLYIYRGAICPLATARYKIRSSSLQGLSAHYNYLTSVSASPPSHIVLYLCKSSKVSYVRTYNCDAVCQFLMPCNSNVKTSLSNLVSPCGFTICQTSSSTSSWVMGCGHDHMNDWLGQ